MLSLVRGAPFDAIIEKATSENNTNENWTNIIEVCDEVTSNPNRAKECLKAILRRMSHEDPHIVMQAITLLDACSSNCGKSFRLVIASREFENDFKRLLSKAQPKVAARMCQVLKSWAENDYRDDPQLNLIPSLCEKLAQEGHDFSSFSDKTKSSKLSVSKDANVVSSQQEEDELAYAIKLSLKESKNSPKHQGTSTATSSSNTANTAYQQSSLYPSFTGSDSLGSVNNTGVVTSSSASSQTEPRKVRALYDFEAAEENELTFVAGEIIHVLDDSDPNWWKGVNQRGDGLFPSNFVTADLSVDPERLDINQQNKNKKNVQFEVDAKELQQKTEAAAVAVANQHIEIDKDKIMRLLHLLNEANPEDPSQDSDEMLHLEQEVLQMGPLIDAELERIDRKHAQLTQLSSDLVDAINMYHAIMRDSANTILGGVIPGLQPPMPGLGGFTEHLTNMQMLYQPAGYTGAGANNFPPQHTQMPQPTFGMPSLPYNNAAQLPTTTSTTNDNSIPTTAVTSVPGNTFSPNTQIPHGHTQMPLPMPFQNGHVNATQLNGGINAMPHMNSPMALGQPQQQQHPYQQNYQMLPQQLTQQTQQTQQPQLQPHTQYTQQQQQQPQPFSQQLPTAAATTATSPMPINVANAATANDIQTQQSTTLPLPQQHQPTTQQQQQFMPAQHQAPPGTYLPHQQIPQQQPHQLQQLQYALGMNNVQPNGPQNFMTQPITNTTTGMLQASATQQQHQQQQQQQPQQLNHSNNNTDQYSQLQQQMATMGINNPLTHNFIAQNEPKNNIPIYQQQH